MRLQPNKITSHHKHIHGQLIYTTIISEALGIPKSFYTYTPPGFVAEQKVSLFFLFRGHEREYVNVNEDNSRTTTTIEKIDELIQNARIKPAIFIMPGLNSEDNHISGLGINMGGKWSKKGLGSGQLNYFLINELVPFLKKTYTITDFHVVGFSLGGFTAVNMAASTDMDVKTMAVYDGLFPFPNHLDPRYDNKPDDVFYTHPVFDATFGKPRNEVLMREWNVTEILLKKDLSGLSCYLQSAASDGLEGNRDRTSYFANLIQKKGAHILNSTKILNTNAKHNWYWNDTFIISYLITIQKLI